MGSFCDGVRCIWAFYMPDDRRGQWHVYLLAKVVVHSWTVGRADTERQAISFKLYCCLAAITGRSRSAADCPLWLLISSRSLSGHFAQTGLYKPLYYTRKVYLTVATAACKSQSVLPVCLFVTGLAFVISLSGRVRIISLFMFLLIRRCIAQIKRKRKRKIPHYII